VPGVAAALAPRRNGWLFAPLVAEIVAAAVFGKDAGPEGEALRPDRFRSRG
jgi:glycine oxidase